MKKPMRINRLPADPIPEDLSSPWWPIKRHLQEDEGSSFLAIIIPTGRGDLMGRHGHRHLGLIEEDRLGTRDFFVEHGLDVQEFVRKDKNLQNPKNLVYLERLLATALGRGQAHQALVVCGHHVLGDTDPEELADHEYAWGLDAGVPLKGFKLSTE